MYTGGTVILENRMESTWNIEWGMSRFWAAAFNWNASSK